MSLHTISVLVEDKPGVLTRVAGLFAARGFNIHSVAVGSYRVPNLEVLVLPDTVGPDAGLLGLNFLKNFRYTVDATRNEFRLERP